MTRPEPFLDGLYFPEGLRWHGGDLWFVDVVANEVVRTSDGRPSTVTTLERPSGLGFLPDGTPLVVTQDGRLWHIEGEGLPGLRADLTTHFRFPANDMVVDAEGRAYIGNYGYDADHGAPPATTRLLRYDPDGSVREEAPELLFPNGAVFTDEGRTFVIAETYADRLTCLRVAEDGSLRDPRRIALPAGSTPDGIDVDAGGGVWVACAYGGAVIRLDREGSITDRVEFPGTGVYCCVLGGDDGRSLFVALASTDGAAIAREPTGRIDVCRVEVPAARAGS